MFKHMKTDNYDIEKLLFSSQIYAVNKRSYETTRQLLVIKVEGSMADLNDITHVKSS